LPRVRFEAYLPPSGATELDLILLLRNLRRRHLDSSVMVASQGIYSEGDALLLDLTAPAALPKVWALCAEALFITPSLATVVTDVQQEDWQSRVDEIWAEDCEAGVSKVRWRPSRFGGRQWAVPAAVVAQGPCTRRVPRSKAVHAAGSLTAEVTLNGSLGYDPEDVVARLVLVLGTRTGLQLSRVPQGQQPGANTWRHAADSDPTAAPGLVRLYLAQPGDLEVIRRELDGRAIQYGEDLVEVQVLTQVGPEAPGNGRPGGHASDPWASGRR